MKKIILASHGNLAQGMRDSVCMLMGDPKEKLEALTLNMGDSTEALLEPTIQKVRSCPQDTFVLITDVFGGSVNNTALCFLEVSNLFVISGMSLGLVLELVASTEEVTRAGLETMLQQAKSGMNVYTADTMPACQAEEF